MFILLGMIFVMVSGLFESIMDKLQFHYDKTPFKYFNNQIFWDPKISWRNKWKDGDSEKGEKFPGSSTIFVGITDSWHLFKLLHNLSLFLGLFLISIGITSIICMAFYFIIARIVFGLSFSLGFKYISK